MQKVYSNENIKTKLSQSLLFKGLDWIANLPSFVTALANQWGLSEIIPVPNMTFNYLAKAILSTGEPVVLKISYDKQSIINEKGALTNLGLQGTVKPINFHSKYNALLVQQAIPAR